MDTTKISNPRRNNDLQLLSTLTPTMCDSVEYLRAELPGCPVDQCRNMLIWKKGDREAAKGELFRELDYTKRECLVRNP